MTGHAAALMAAIERAEARRILARSAPHLFVPMPDGRCNLCNLGLRRLGGDRMGPDALTHSDHNHFAPVRHRIALPQVTRTHA